jgi:hypothetical protein
LIAVAAQALARVAQAREVVARECQRADELHRRSERALSATAASEMTDRAMPGRRARARRD